MNLKKKKKLYEECNSKTKPSFLLLSTSAVSRYSKQLRLPIHYQQENDAEAIRIWILEDFFVCFSLSLCRYRHFFSSDQQGAALTAFLHYILFSYRHQFKQKKKDSVRRERNFLFIPSIAFDTHTHTVVDIPGFAF